MATFVLDNPFAVNYTSPLVKKKRIESIDLLRGIVMIVMALDHVRHVFHQDAYLYDPMDLTKTSVPIFFTRWITHYCAPVFVFLAGISVYLHGVNMTRRELANYLFKRGLWLVIVEFFIISLATTFNPTYPVINLQVIWAIGISMMVLSALIYLKREFILIICVFLIAGHNLLDNVHVPGGGFASFIWSVLHEPADYVFGRYLIVVKYPVLPWIGILTLGYYLGHLFSAHYDPEKRMKVLILLGFISMELFFFLRTMNNFGDSGHWTNQKNAAYSLLSYLNVTKYPPSLLYSLITLGPAMIFLAVADQPLNAVTRRIIVFGRVPFFYYIVHLYVIHLLALIAAVVTGFGWKSMILSTKINLVPGLKGFGFNLLSVYLAWIALILVMYPLCKWYGRFKKNNLSTQGWLSYV
jgi:uncharacterized membrane protein